MEEQRKHAILFAARAGGHKPSALLVFSPLIAFKYFAAPLGHFAEGFLESPDEFVYLR